MKEIVLALLISLLVSACGTTVETYQSGTVVTVAVSGSPLGDVTSDVIPRVTLAEAEETSQTMQTSEQRQTKQPAPVTSFLPSESQLTSTEAPLRENYTTKAEPTSMKLSEARATQQNSSNFTTVNPDIRATSSLLVLTKSTTSAPPETQGSGSEHSTVPTSQPNPVQEETGLSTTITSTEGRYTESSTVHDVSSSQVTTEADTAEATTVAWSGTSVSQYDTLGNSDTCWLFSEYGGEAGAEKAAMNWAYEQLLSQDSPFTEYVGFTMWTIFDEDYQAKGWTVHFYAQDISAAG